jgi:solute carrier family 25 (mitochondrial carnitine/acylcarnitine transporter), member 20/29
VVDCARKTIKWEGVAGLYKGVSAPLAGQMFFRAGLFSALGSSKRFLSTDAQGQRRMLTTLDYYKAGAMAGGAAAFFEGPIDFYKSQV